MNFRTWWRRPAREVDNNISTVAEDIQDYHITPEQAGIVARDAGIPYLIITHVLPPVPFNSWSIPS